MENKNDKNEPGANDRSRAPFEQLGVLDSPDDTIDGTKNAERISGDAKDGVGGTPSLPGPLACWSFVSHLAHLYEDAKGRPSASVYQFENNPAIVVTSNVTRRGPDGMPNSALQFNGEDPFAFINHDPCIEVAQGAVSVWLQADAVH